MTRPQTTRPRTASAASSGCDRPSWRHVQPVRQRLWVRLPWRHRPAGAVLLSTLDAIGWRHGIPEQVYPEALVPGLREVGGIFSGDMWGTSIRAAVPAPDRRLQDGGRHRPARRRYHHANRPAPRLPPHARSPKDGYWPAGELKEGDASTGKWQELTPSLSLNCAVFPNSGPKTQAVDGDYAWALWRPYSCCQRKGQIFLGSTDFQ